MVKILVKIVDKETKELLKEETQLERPYSVAVIQASYPGYKSETLKIMLEEEDQIITMELTKED